MTSEQGHQNDVFSHNAPFHGTFRQYYTTSPDMNGSSRTRSSANIGIDSSSNEKVVRSTQDKPECTRQPCEGFSAGVDASSHIADLDAFGKCQFPPQHREAPIHYFAENYPSRPHRAGNITGVTGFPFKDIDFNPGQQTSHHLEAPLDFLSHPNQAHVARSNNDSQVTSESPGHNPAVHDIEVPSATATRVCRRGFNSGTLSRVSSRAYATDKSWGEQKPTGPLQ